MIKGLNAIIDGDVAELKKLMMLYKMEDDATWRDRLKLTFVYQKLPAKAKEKVWKEFWETTNGKR